jgi:hypothetical protein
MASMRAIVVKKAGGDFELEESARELDHAVRVMTAHLDRLATNLLLGATPVSG